MTFLYIGLLTIAYTWFLIPTFDDGFYLNQFINIYVGRSNFNDFLGTYIHFQKPHTYLQAFIYKASGYSLFVLNLFHSMTILLSVLLTYKLLHPLEPKLRVTGLTLMFYMIVSHFWVSTTRPELIILPLCLAVILSIKNFESSGEQKYLKFGIAAACFSVPIHYNCTIPCIFMIFYLCKYALQRKLTYATYFFGIFCSAIALSVLVYPGIESFIQSFKAYDGIGDRWSMFSGEVGRVKWFLSYRYYVPLFIILLCALPLRIEKIKLVLSEIPRFIFTYTLITFFCFVFLPTSKWPVYCIYLLIPFVYAFVVVLRHSETLLIKLPIVSAIILGVSFFSMRKEHLLFESLYIVLCLMPIFLVFIQKLDVDKKILYPLMSMSAFLTLNLYSDWDVFRKAEKIMLDTNKIVSHLSLSFIDYRRMNSNPNVPLHDAMMKIYKKQQTVTVIDSSAAIRSIQKSDTWCKVSDSQIQSFSPRFSTKSPLNDLWVANFTLCQNLSKRSLVK